MRLNIGSLVGKKGASFQVEDEVPSDFVAKSPDVEKVLSPVSLKLTVSNTGEGYLVVGDLEVALALRCSRCLRPMETKMTASVEEEYLNRPREQNSDDSMWEEEPLVEANELDLTPLIEESVLMNIPMKAICRTDCPGLCSVCGADLIKGDCGCESPDIDIRLAPLSNLLKSLETKSAERRKDHGSTKKKTFKSKD